MKTFILLIALAFSGWHLPVLAGTSGNGWISGMVNTAAGDIALSGLPYHDPEAKGVFTSITLPIRRANNLIIVEARIDSLAGNFILDLGAPYLVLNKTYFRDYHTDPLRHAGSVNSRSNTVSRTTVQRLELADLYYEKLAADVVNLAEIENKRGIKILGLLGVNLFKELEVEIDLQQNVIRLHRAQQEIVPLPSGSKLSAVPDLELEFALYNDVILLEAAIGSRRLRFSLDTAAEVNVLDNGLGSKVLKYFTVDRRMMLTGASGMTTEVLAGSISEMWIGEVPIRNMKAVITNLGDMSSAYGIRIDGMLGYDFFAEGIVSINFPQKKLRLFFYNENSE